ncbi:MAG: zinc-binding alcohol dehydrogenase family protein [candidate division NC10 bacterium]|nr:zinc-binding alcohol dehydrogenase family protein [candidate division NC10 bacterium]
MKAIGQHENGGPEVLQFVTIPKPVPRPRDILVRVKAVSVNPVDAKVRRGMIPYAMSVANPPLILGWDAAGVVEELGDEAGRFKIGDEVCFAGVVNRPGSYAEFVAVDERIVGKKLKTLSFEEAAAIPLTAITAWEAFIENMNAPKEATDPQRTALIVGGAGGVGSIAIQIAKRVCSLYAVATASRPASVEFCKKMGADAVIDHTKDLAIQLKTLGLNGVDYVLNCAPLTNFPQLVPLLNPLGKICCILAGEPAKALDVSGLMLKRGMLSFEVMWCRPMLDVQPEKQGRLLDEVADLLDQKVLVSPMTTVMDWSEVQEAHRAIETGHTVGKIVLKVSS